MIAKFPVLEARHQTVSREVLASFPKGGYTFFTEACIANFVQLRKNSNSSTCADFEQFQKCCNELALTELSISESHYLAT